MGARPAVLRPLSWILPRSRTARQLRALLAHLPPERIQQLRRVVAFSFIPGVIDLASVAVIARLMGSLVGSDLEDRLPGVKVFGGNAADQSLWLILMFVILSWIASFGKFGLQFLQQRLTARTTSCPSCSKP